VTLSLSPTLFSLLTSIGEEHLADVFGVATLKLEENFKELTEEEIQDEVTDVHIHHGHYISKVSITHSPNQSETKKHLVKIIASKANGSKCERCWRYIVTDSSPLCVRCRIVLDGHLSH
jgi:hypothetical protein